MSYIKLLEELKCPKGMTLNSQLVDLFFILEDENLTIEDQNKAIEEYRDKLVDRQKRYEYIKKNHPKDVTKFVLNEVLEKLGITEQDIKDIYMDSVTNGRIFDKEQMEKTLQNKGFDPDINNQLYRTLNNMDFMAKEGIKDIVPEDVRNLYNHIFPNGKDGKARYDRITIDGPGRFSSFIAVDGKTVIPDKLDTMIRFNKSHGMKSKINTMMMYCDMPKALQAYTDKQVDENLLTNEDRKKAYKEMLFNYAQKLGEMYGDEIDSVDIFNELIYDPDMIEAGFEEDGKTYEEREQGWQKYLTIDDLCEFALIARNSMPNVTFTYNDMHWTNPEKREKIINIINQIKTKEAEFRKAGRLTGDKGLIDTIGLEAHLDTSISINEMENVIKDILRNNKDKNMNLPIEITELDVARYDNSKKSRNKQNEIFRAVVELVKKYSEEIKVLSTWSQNDKISFLNEKSGKNCYASILDANSEEKDIAPQRTFGIDSFKRLTQTRTISKVRQIVEKIRDNVKGKSKTKDAQEQSNTKESNNSYDKGNR